MRWLAGIFAASLVVSLLLAAPTVRADNGYHGDFYTPPDPLPAGAPGDVIRTEPSDVHLADDRPDLLGITATRILYRSTNTHDQPVAVSGTFIEPTAPWPGPGPRPLISFAVGTHGQGDQCAPSRLIDVYLYHSRPLDVFLEYELVIIQRMIKRGWAVVMTDYIGLGTPGVHTYVVRADEGHAVLDAARAAYRLPNTDLDPRGPLALYGYSQGGGATAAAAELAPTYAPELPIVGTYAGAPPADLSTEFPYLDGSLAAGILGYVINAAIAAYPEDADAIHAVLTPDGEDLIAKTQNQCLGETIANFMFRHIARYLTIDADTAITTEPFKTIFDQQRIGRLKPTTPVLINSNRYDPLVPYGPALQLGHDWCALGANVEFNTNEEPPLFNKLILNHGLPIIVDAHWVLDWVADRLGGVPATPNCGDF
ncbi:secretory lipase family protein [Mycolicibacterium madagascariense]|uniref:Secretory lipase family protein n=1 Tax=Mycolicibacterium madagascariense TaxID=212765 RepID=A0A7I7XE88_9MYCO|nr:lipase family protein [Mycolicibacterium madagascariense]MCV7015260.1 triacylglycerol lipase [Mycolicibacterium madagascariense]BBZ27553.1 secretory lipase family protein [Mycolicibacterium madagascariense]